ncbi:hypothetical protein D7X33_21015 [Butyricicoccus sp. 1XD8-22]|nr:hypothetical protein D7X33_21015 [Butyricicoccus sp. 1XD8-22]
MIGFLTAYWIEIVLAIILLTVIGYFVYLFYTKQLDKVKQWLLIAVIESEKYFGSKTGKIKLADVYSAFVTKYPILKVFVSFEKFSSMVDIALDEMRHLLETNEAVKNVVVKDDVVKVEAMEVKVLEGEK